MSLFRSINGRVTEVSGTSKRKDSAVSRLVNVYREIEKIGFEDLDFSTIPNWRPKLYEVIDDKIQGIDYGPDDLQKLAFMMLDLEYQDDILRGSYIGGLVSKLTEKNKNELVEVKFDLEHQEFPYFCYVTEKVGNLYIANTNGDSVGSYVASFGGFAENIKLDKCNGFFVGSSIAREGSVNSLLFVNSGGFYFGSNIAERGYSELVYFENCNGGNLGTLIGSNGGNSNITYFVNCKGDRIGSAIAQELGNANVVAYKNCTGNMIAKETGLGGKVELLSVKDTDLYFLLSEGRGISLFDNKGEHICDIDKLVRSYLKNQKAMQLGLEVKKLLSKVSGVICNESF